MGLPGEPTAAAAKSAIGTCGSAPRGDLTTSAYVEGGWRAIGIFDSGEALGLGARITVDLCQWANHADDTMPIEFEPMGKTIKHVTQMA